MLKTRVLGIFMCNKSINLLKTRVLSTFLLQNPLVLEALAKKVLRSRVLGTFGFTLFELCKTRLSKQHFPLFFRGGGLFSLTSAS